MRRSHVFVVSTATVVLTALVAAVAALAVTGGPIRALNPARLPVLPRQGLIVEQGNGVLLETTGGGVIGRLAGFSVAPPQNLAGRRFGRSVAIGALVGADPRLTVLFDRAGDGWILDVVNRRMSRMAKIEAPLAGGAEIKIILDGKPSTGWSTKTLIERNGTKLLEGLFVAVIDDRYATTTYDLGPHPTELLDLVSGRRVSVQPHCTAVGVLGTDVIATCVPLMAAQPSTLYLFKRDGSARLLSTFVPGLTPASAWLSPNGRWVLLYLQPNCGLGWAAIASTEGGPVRLVGGIGAITDPRSAAPQFSDPLGWTNTNQMVVTIVSKNPPGCSGVPSAGTFVVGPSNLTRHRATVASASELWGRRT